MQYVWQSIALIILQNIGRLASSQQKKPGKCLRRFPFVLRHCECDGRLPIHPRSSTTCTPVSLLVLVCPLGVAGLWVARCGYSRMPHLIIMHNIYSSVRLLRLDSKCSAERQQLQCSTVLLHVATVLRKCMLSVNR